MKKTIATLILMITTFGASAVSAGSSSVQEILGELSKLAVEKQELERGFKAALSIKRDLDAEGHTLDEKRQRLEVRRGQLQDYCTGEYPEPEYSSRLAKCNSAGRVLNSDIDAHNEEVSSFAARYRALTNTVGKMSQRDNEIEKRVGYLTARLKGLQLFANSNCGNAKELETVADCFQHEWDGAERHDIRIPDPPGLQ